MSFNNNHIHKWRMVGAETTNRGDLRVLYRCLRCSCWTEVRQSRMGRVPPHTGDFPRVEDSILKLNYENEEEEGEIMSGLEGHGYDNENDLERRKGVLNAYKKGVLHGRRRIVEELQKIEEKINELRETSTTGGYVNSPEEDILNELSDTVSVLKKHYKNKYTGERRE